MAVLYRLDRSWGFEAPYQGCIQKTKKIQVTHSKAGGGVLIEMMWVGSLYPLQPALMHPLFIYFSSVKLGQVT